MRNTKNSKISAAAAWAIAAQILAWVIFVALCIICGVEAQDWVLAERNGIPNDENHHVVVFWASVGITLAWLIWCCLLTALTKFLDGIAENETSLE